MELLKDYDIEVKYYPSEANVVVEGLTQKPVGSVACLLTQEKRLLRELDALQIKIVILENQIYLVALHITSPLVEEI